jgi:mannose-6-phosphate isomerase-like protein (cupin superfamily)
MAIVTASVSKVINHKTVEEGWYILEGEGELYRNPPNTEGSITNLSEGVVITIPRNTIFQFRNTHPSAPLKILIMTTPRWPGEFEADKNVVGKWD